MRGVARDANSRLRRQREPKSTLYLLEEPTIGLHMAELVVAHGKQSRTAQFLRESAEYELAQLVEKQPGLLDTVAAKRIAALEAELAELKTKAERLATEIEELTGESATSIG